MNRRALLRAAGPAALVLAAPALGAAEPSQDLAALIAAHRAAWIELEAAYDRFEPILLHCNLEPERVQYGRRALTHEPLYVSTVEEIEGISHQTFGPMLTFSDTPEHAAAVEQRRRAFVARKTAELESIVAANDAEMERHGYSEASAAVDDATDVERKLRVAVLLYRPANAAESAQRQRYLEHATPFVDGSCANEAFVADLLEALGVRGR